MAEIGANMWDNLSSLSIRRHGLVSEKADGTVCPALRAQRIFRSRSEQVYTCKHSALSSPCNSGLN